jgi:hypothetical protein
MTQMGKYCKAYPIERFREYEHWKEEAQTNGEDKDTNLETTEGDSNKSRYLYLQENYTVTDGIFIDENIVFDQVTPEWVDFCQHKLNFEIPRIEPIKSAQVDEVV